MAGAPASSAITVPGANGSDGSLNITTSASIDLAQAAPGAWDGTSPVAGKGVYDSQKWAVVYHYTSVNIAPGQTLTFKNNAARAPVVWLVGGDVTTAGTLELTGGAVNSGIPQPEPGPGGFAGGKATLTSGLYAGPNGAGWGPGGAQRGLNSAGHSTAGAGTLPGDAYGTAQVIPLLGGSGAGGTNFAGAAGGGAILIAATGTITITGTLRANGGVGNNGVGANMSASGSGGAIRLVADAVLGAGSITAVGGTIGQTGAAGRIRIEGNSVSASLSTNPLPSAVAPGATAQIWPAESAPSVRIVSIGGVPVPAEISGRLNAAADVLPDILPASQVVVLETKNVATTAAVRLRVAPLSGDAYTVPCTFSSGDVNTALWAVSITPTPGSTAFQARVEP